MSLVEEYYELNEAEEVSVVWKILQILLYGCAGTFGLWCGFTLSNLRLKFDDRCYLFTEVRASIIDQRIDQRNINWESDSWCDYYQFSMVSSFIVGIIWATLFLMCGKGGKSLTGLPQPWRIVWPSLIFNFIYFIITLTTAISIQQGTDHFCGRYQFNTKIRSKSLLEGCEPLILLMKKDIYLISLQLEMTVKTSWACTISWFVLFLLSFIRILFVVDFHMYKICVFKIDDTVQNKKEEVLRITNYEEPKKLYFGRDDERRISDAENNPEDLEAGTRKKPKPDKKSTRHHFNVTNRSPHKSTAVFYETTDIRMLNREKKRKKTSRALDEAFGKNKANVGFGLRRSIKVQSNPEVSTHSGISTFWYEHSKELYKDEGDDGDDDIDDDDDARSSFATQRPDFKEDWDDSGSGSEILVGDFDSNRFLRFKKRI